MKTGRPAREIDDKPTSRQNVSSDESVVWRVKGGEVHHIDFEIGGGDEDARALRAGDFKREEFEKAQAG